MEKVKDDDDRAGDAADDTLVADADAMEGRSLAQ